MNRHRSDEKDSRAIRADLVSRLRAQNAAICAAIFSRIRNISEPVGERDPGYGAGLEGAIGDAVNFSLETIEMWPEPPAHLPAQVLAQARRAAREGVRLDTAVRRYTAGNKILEDFVVEAAAGMPDTVLRQILSDQGDQLERVMDAVSTAYREELARMRRSAANRRTDRIVRLLESEVRVPPADLDYDFELWHVAIILRGNGAAVAARVLAERLGTRSLHGEREEEIVWTWLGSRRKPSIVEVMRSAREWVPDSTSLVIGEPHMGLDGWRLTHREAQAALPVTWQRPERVTRGRDVILLAAVLKDETFVCALQDTYLAPLEQHGNQAEALRDTLRAFFAAGWNAAAAGEKLAIDRHTVRQRIKRIEKILDQPLSGCSAELQIALQVADLTARPTVAL